MSDKGRNFESKPKENLALILARGGSKGLLGKNIRPLAGKPLIGWTLEQAHQSKCINRVVVSTDDLQIARIAQEFGGEVPVLRPDELATDHARSIDGITHMIDYLSEMEGYLPNFITLLQPTSPLRTANDIDAAMDMLISNSAEAVISVCETEHHPWWSNTLPGDNCMQGFLTPEVQHLGRQQLPQYYHINGAIYLAKLKYFKAVNGFLGKDTFALIMPRERSVDIDSLLDFQIAELLLKKLELPSKW